MSTPPSSPVILVRPRVYFGESLPIGPGKIDLLQEIEKTRSIAAARAMGMPYKRAWLWLLIDSSIPVSGDSWSSPPVAARAGAAQT